MDFDRVALVIKPGNQEHKTGLKHGCPVCYIDESTWDNGSKKYTLEQIIGKKEKKSLLWVEISRELIPFVEEALKEIGNAETADIDNTYRPRKNLINWVALATKTGVADIETKALDDKYEKPIYNGLSLDENDFVDYSGVSLGE